MSKRLLAIFVLALTVSLAACGSSSHSASGPGTSASSSSPQSTSSTSSTKPKPAAAAPRHGGSAPHARPAPSGGSRPSPPPPGLRASSGFGTYELCSGACSGSVPDSLRRPLRAPSSCSPHPAGGPVRPSPADPLSITSFIGSSWKAGRVTWSSGGYSGPLLIRGRQVDGPGAVGFGEGHSPYDELQLQGSGPWQSFTRVLSSGCFYYQVDGTSFSETIVFHAQ